MVVVSRYKKKLRSIQEHISHEIELRLKDLQFDAELYELAKLEELLLEVN